MLTVYFIFFTQDQTGEIEKEIKQKLEKEHLEHVSNLKKNQNYNHQSFLKVAKIEQQKTNKEREVQKELEAQRFKMKDKDYLEHQLAQYLPTVVEMNLMAKELKRNIYFTAKLAQIFLDSEEEASAEDDDKTKNLKIQIKVKKITLFF